MTSKKSQRSKYSAEQIAHWNACANDCRRGSIVCGDATVLKFISGKGMCRIQLEQWTP